MTLTKKQENILKKQIEVDTERSKWNTLSASYQAKIRKVIALEESKIKADKDAMSVQHALIETKESELKILVGA